MRISQSVSEFGQLFDVSPEKARLNDRKSGFPWQKGDVSVETGGITSPFNKGEIGKTGYSWSCLHGWMASVCRSKTLDICHSWRVQSFIRKHLLWSHEDFPVWLQSWNDVGWRTLKVTGASSTVGLAVGEDRELICGSGLVTSNNPSMARGALLMTHMCFQRGPSSTKLKVCIRKMEKQRGRATIPVPRTSTTTQYQNHDSSSSARGG